MGNRSFDSLVAEITPNVPGCPYPMILSQVRNAAIRACERTLAWRYQCPVFPLQVNVHEYPYNVPVGTEVHAMFDTFINNKPMQRLTLEQGTHYIRRGMGNLFQLVQENDNPVLAEDGAGLIDATTEGLQTGEPQIVFAVTPDTCRFYPVPNGERTYEVYMFVALKPKRTATGMDEVVLGELQDVIIHGTLQHLLVMPNKNWQDRELASYHAKQYIFHLNERRARANLGNVRGAFTAKMQSFGA